MSIRTPKLIAIALTLSVSVALLAFAACGGGDDNASATASGAAHNTNTATSNAGATHTDQATNEATDTPDTSNPFAELENLTGDLEQTTGKATYNITDSDGSTSTMTFYSEAGSQRSRFDTTDSDANVTSFITNADGSFSCDSSSQSCIGYGNSGLGAGLGLGFTQFFSADYIDLYVQAARASGVNVDQSSETHAGVDSDCFSWSDNSDPNDVSTGKLCFGNDTHTLLYEEFGDSSGTTIIEATAFDDSVSDSDFQLPYPVSTIISSG